MEAYPSRLAQWLLTDQADVGLLPVAVIPKLKTSYLISDYCISCNGPVASVCLFSQVPINKVEKIYLDYQSKTSVLLTRILAKEYWHIAPEFTEADGEEYRENISGTAAGLVIGDRAFEERKKSAFIYDLGEAWYEHTGLPFVFAAWVANKKLSSSFLDAFNEANGIGIHQLDKVIQELPTKNFDLKDYFTKNIDYHFTADKQKGMELFFKKIVHL